MQLKKNIYNNIYVYLSECLCVCVCAYVSVCCTVMSAVKEDGNRTAYQLTKFYIQLIHFHIFV